MKSEHMPEILRLPQAIPRPCILCDTPTKYRGQWTLADPTTIGLPRPRGGGRGRIIYVLCAAHTFDEYLVAIVEELIRNKIASYGGKP